MVRPLFQPVILKKKQDMGSNVPYCDSPHSLPHLAAVRWGITVIILPNKRSNLYVVKSYLPILHDAIPAINQNRCYRLHHSLQATVPSVHHINWFAMWLGCGCYLTTLFNVSAEIKASTKWLSSINKYRSLNRWKKFILKEKRNNFELENICSERYG